MSLDTSVAVDMETMGLIREMAEHENMTYKEIVSKCVFKYWSVWKVL